MFIINYYAAYKISENLIIISHKPLRPGSSTAPSDIIC